MRLRNIFVPCSVNQQFLRRTMKRPLLMVTAFVVLISMVLVACGEETTTTTTTPAATTSTPTSTPAATTTSPATTAPAATSQAPDSAKYGGVLVRAMTSDTSRPIGFPAEADNAATTLTRPCLESLVSVTRDGEIVPELAVTWEVAADGKSITLGLRKGVKFHDGSDFNAEVCKWNLDMIIESKRTTDWTSIDVIDDYTIRINVKQYKNTMLSNLALGYTQQISKASFDKNGQEWTRWNPVGTGPFIFASHEREVKLVYERNPNYWDPGKPYLDGVEIVVIPDNTVQKLAFQMGDIHRLQVSGLTIQELQQDGYEMIAEPGGTFILIPDSKNPSSHWANINVRLAASYAIDRDLIAESLGFGHMQPAYQVYPSFKQTAIPNLDKHEYDPARAKALLKEAGYPSGFKTVMHCFFIIPDTVRSAVASMLQEVGINIEIDTPTGGKYTELRFNGWNDSVMFHAVQNYSNFVGMEDYWLGLQFPSVQLPPGFREGLEAAGYTLEPDPELIQAVIRVMHDNVMVIPVAEEVRVNFLGKGVHDPGTDDYSLMSWIWDEIWLEPSAR